jgi:2-methylcitrate dehydratase
VNDHLLHALAKASVGLPRTDDADVVHEVERRYLDSFACAFGAFRHDGPAAARRYAEASDVGDGGVTIWGTDHRTSPETAALVNGAAVRFLDLNDAYFGLESLHPSDMLAGLLAVGEKHGRSGADVVDAAAVGYEVAMTLCDAMCVHCRGWDHVNILGIGAAAATARLIGLGEEQTRHALALQVTGHSALRQTRFGTLSMWKGFAAGNAVRQAVYVCSLAAAGVEGPAEAFEGKHGFLNQLLGGEVGEAAALERLSQISDPARRILDSHIKWWPFGYVAQSAVEAAETLRAQVDDIARIARIEVTTFDKGVDFMCSPEKWEPTTRETADHSLPYVVGEMVRRGVVDEQSFHPDSYGTEETHDFLKQKVFVSVDDDFTRRYGPEFPARVRLILEDGSVLEEELSNSRGHARRPVSDEDLIEKFWAQFGSRDEASESLVAMTLGMSSLDDVRSLTSLLGEVRVA